MKNKFYMLLLFFLASVWLCACHADEVQEPQIVQTTTPIIPVIVPKGDYSEPPIVDYSLRDLPQFVNDLSQCTDPEKQYVLPDGYLYGYTSKIVPSATNQLHLATDIDGSLFCNCGYQDNARIRGILEIGETDYSFITGFIPIQANDIIYFSSNCFLPQHEGAHILHTVLYNAEKKVIGQTSMKEAPATYFEVLETDALGSVITMRVSPECAPKGLSYVRFTLIGSGAQQVLSINESLDEGTEVLDWIQLEKYVSPAWCEEIAATIETVDGIKLSDPSTAICFVFASDIHVDPDAAGSYTGDLGKVCAEVMRQCEIPFFATGGDNCTQSSGFMPSDFEENMKVVLEQLSPIPQKNILLTVGNHDGATGSREIDGEKVYYRYQLSNEERSSVFFDWQRETNKYKRFDSDGTYYYLDDAVTKTRYIVLNSFWSDWEGEENGFVTDIQHSFFHTPMFGPKQLRWFATEALAMSPDYGAVIITHCAPVAIDFEIFKGIVDAFTSRTDYQGSYIGMEEWQSTDITVNYEYADGEIVAVFQGHNHEDAVHDYFKNVPCINVTTAGAYWSVKGENHVERIRGTETEFAADVVVVDREKRTIYITRLGAGDDRMILF